MDSKSPDIRTAEMSYVWMGMGIAVALIVTLSMTCITLCFLRHRLKAFCLQHCSCCWLRNAAKLQPPADGHTGVELSKVSVGDDGVTTGQVQLSRSEDTCPKEPTAPAQPTGTAWVKTLTEDNRELSTAERSMPTVRQSLQDYVDISRAVQTSAGTFVSMARECVQTARSSLQRPERKTAKEVYDAYLNLRSGQVSLLAAELMLKYSSLDEGLAKEYAQSILRSSTLRDRYIDKALAYRSRRHEYDRLATATPGTSPCSSSSPTSPSGLNLSSIASSESCPTSPLTERSYQSTSTGLSSVHLNGSRLPPIQETLEESGACEIPGGQNLNVFSYLSSEDGYPASFKETRSTSAVGKSAWNSPLSLTQRLTSTKEMGSNSGTSLKVKTSSTVTWNPGYNLSRSFEGCPKGTDKNQSLTYQSEDNLKSQQYSSKFQNYGRQAVEKFVRAFSADEHSGPEWKRTEGKKYVSYSDAATAEVRPPLNFSSANTPSLETRVIGCVAEYDSYYGLSASKNESDTGTHSEQIAHSKQHRSSPSPLYTNIFRKVPRVSASSPIDSHRVC